MDWEDFHESYPVIGSNWERIIEKSQSLSGIPTLELTVKDVIPVTKRTVRKNIRLLLECASQEYRGEEGLEKWVRQARAYTTGIVYEGKRALISRAPHLSVEEKISTIWHELGHIWFREVLSRADRDRIEDFVADQVKKMFFPWLLPDPNTGIVEIADEVIASGYAVSIIRGKMREWVIQDALANLATYFKRVIDEVLEESKIEGFGIEEEEDWDYV